MERNSTNSGRKKVEKLIECRGMPTLVYYGDGTMAIQHPIVFDLMQPLVRKDKQDSSSESESNRLLGIHKR
jgi:hypothetical protein